MDARHLLTICRCSGVELQLQTSGRLAAKIPENLQHFRPVLQEYAAELVEALKTGAISDHTTESKTTSREMTARAAMFQDKQSLGSDEVPCCRGPVVFDIETDSLEPTHIWCICAVELDSGREHVFGPDELGKACAVLNSALWLIGHNIIGFDLPTLHKLRPDFDPLGDVYDTLILSRMLFPEHQRHRLQDWGDRLTCAKQQPPKFDQWSEEMAEYCRQDVRLNVQLWHHLMELQPPMPAVRLEMQFAQDCHHMTQHGICFDIDAALALRQTLQEQRQMLKSGLQEAFREDAGTLFGDVTELNPSSSQQVAEALCRKYGWTAPTSAAGNPICDEATLSKLNYPEARSLLQYREASGHLQKLSDGPRAWLKQVKAGRIHHRINTCATITGRCSHSGPNLAQVPAEARFRRLFKPTVGKVLVGVDLSGIEARCLAHYLHQYDGGEFTKTLLQGDIHEFNRQAAGLETRAQAKRLLYATLYGGGPALIGDIVGGGAAQGKAVLDRWLQQVPALQQLKTAIKLQFQSRGFIQTIDGRHIKPRQAHSALNALLQSCAAVVSKLWAVLAVVEVSDAGRMLLHVHDETQWEAEPDRADVVAQTVVWAAAEAGRRLKLQVPVAAESRRIAEKTTTTTH